MSRRECDPSAQFREHEPLHEAHVAIGERLAHAVVPERVRQLRQRADVCRGGECLDVVMSQALQLSADTAKTGRLYHYYM